MVAAVAGGSGSGAAAEACSSAMRARISCCVTRKTLSAGRACRTAVLHQLAKGLDPALRSSRSVQLIALLNTEHPYAGVRKLVRLQQCNAHCTGSVRLG